MAALFDLEALVELVQEDIDAATATRCRARAGSYLRRVLHIELTQAERSHVARVPASCTFIRLRGPLVSVESVTAAGVPLTDYTVTATGVSRPNGFGTGWSTVDIAFTNGLDDIPDDIADAGLYLAAQAYRLGPLTGLTQETVGGVTVIADGDIAGAGGLALPDDMLRALQAEYGRPPASSRGVTSALIR